MQGECSVEGFEAKDSRGTPTVGARVTYQGITEEALVPSGKSAGSREAKELRDGDGTGVSQAIRNINTHINDLLRSLPFDPLGTDTALCALDGTEDKSKLGANAMLAVSMALRRVAAKQKGVPLWKYISEESGNLPQIPRLYMNVINGGAHANFALPFQEYIIIVSGEDAGEMYEKAKKLFTAIGERVHRDFTEVSIGDEGGYVFHTTDLKKPFAMLHEIVRDLQGVELAIDAAATELYQEHAYHLSGEQMTTEDLSGFYQEIVKEYGVRSIEDPFTEHDYSAFRSLQEQLGQATLIVGDDLTVTNPDIVKEMIEQRAVNAMIIKPNQIGTLREVYETVRLAKAASWKLIASHRSGETPDSFIADLAVGIGAYGIKAGAPTQVERRAKYERLTTIQQELQS